MKLRQIAGPCCKGIKCHAVFEEPGIGTVIIQGQRPSDEIRAAISVGEGEDLLLVPRELLLEAANYLRSA